VGTAQLVSGGLCLLERIGQLPELLVKLMLIMVIGLLGMERSFLPKTEAEVAFHC
jgi:hypothetical protein